MLDIFKINQFLQERLRQENRQNVGTTEAARWLDQEGLLRDSISRPGKPLRNLLRARKIVGQRQGNNRRWSIDRVDDAGGIKNFNDNSGINREGLGAQGEGNEILPDILAKGLRVVFVGTAVGDTSARKKHYYSNPQNAFYKELYRAGLTPTQLLPEEDQRLLSYGIGLTDLVKDIHSSNDATISTSVLSEGIKSFRRKLKKFKPAWVCFNGKKAYESLMGASAEFGFVNLTIESCKVFIVPSTSGRVLMNRRFNGKTRSEWFLSLASYLSADPGDL